MFFDRIPDQSNATYYKLEKKINTGKKEQPGIGKWNKENQTMDFISTKIGGNLASVKLGEEKTVITKAGQDFILQSVFLELKNIDENGKIFTAILDCFFNDSLTYSLLGKLMMIDDYTNLNFSFYNYFNKAVPPKLVNGVSIHKGIPSGIEDKGALDIFIKKEEYRKNPNQILLAPKLWSKKNGKVIEFVEGYQDALLSWEGKRKPELDPDWSQQLKEQMIKCIDIINAKCVPLQVPVYQDKKADTENENIDDLPEIDINSINIQMPF